MTITLALTLLVYILVGFFGVAHFGAHTKGNVLENIKGGWAPLLDVLVSVYLAIGVPPTQFSLRCTIEDMTVGTGALLYSVGSRCHPLAADFKDLVSPSCAICAICAIRTICAVCTIMTDD